MGETIPTMGFVSAPMGKTIFPMGIVSVPIGIVSLPTESRLRPWVLFLR
jgi:hypothetical protein